MSVQSTQTAQCGYCNGPRDPNASVRGSFCSRACYLRDRGSRVLDSIRRDHTICPSCFSHIKEVERPDDSTLVEAEVPKSIREIFVGYQYSTEHTEFVEAETTTVDTTKPIIRRAWGCQCGTAEGDQPDPTVERVEGERVVINLLRELQLRYDRGELDHQPSRRLLFETLREHGRDWPLAVGRALYGE